VCEYLFSLFCWFQFFQMAKNVCVQQIFDLLNDAVLVQTGIESDGQGGYVTQK
jgi:hypothetical protein